MLTPVMERALIGLRDYLDEGGFVDVYKSMLTSSAYYSNPHFVNRLSAARMTEVLAHLGREGSGQGLVLCLLFEVLISYASLAAAEQRLADLLVDAGLLFRSGDLLGMGAWQLISVQNMVLLVDKRTNYPDEAVPDVYLGGDSLQLAYYVDTTKIRPADHVLDLGAGSGVVGLSLGRHASHVVLTDVSPQAVTLAAMNRLLNRLEQQVEIRKEGYEETLRKSRKYQVVTFNPPFMAVPTTLKAPDYARGIGPDGLGYCRMLLQSMEQILAREGTAYLATGFPGDVDGPFFMEELRQIADMSGLRIDVHVYSSTELRGGSPVFAPLGDFLHKENLGVSREDCRREVEDHYLRGLGVSCIFLSVATVRFAQNLRPSARFFNRLVGSLS